MNPNAIHHDVRNRKFFGVFVLKKKINPKRFHGEGRPETERSSIFIFQSKTKSNGEPEKKQLWSWSIDYHSKRMTHDTFVRYAALCKTWIEQFSMIQDLKRMTHNVRKSKIDRNHDRFFFSR